MTWDWERHERHVSHIRRAPTARGMRPSSSGFEEGIATDRGVDGNETRRRPSPTDVEATTARVDTDSDTYANPHETPVPKKSNAAAWLLAIVELVFFFSLMTALTFVLGSLIMALGQVASSVRTLSEAFRPAWY
ncbi:hypothetical protein GGR55DRAFT_678523 [Xylaria sp. FL0064]|nr:hypothetical protein GGR55DRAFT_678523 [Xylaria sp. FL0064]